MATSGRGSESGLGSGARKRRHVLAYFDVHRRRDRARCQFGEAGGKKACRRPGYADLSSVKLVCSHDFDPQRPDLLDELAALFSGIGLDRLARALDLDRSLVLQAGNRADNYLFSTLTL